LRSREHNVFAMLMAIAPTSIFCGGYDMDKLNNKIRGIIGNCSEAIWSVADIAYSDYKEVYTKAIVIAQSYNCFIINEAYDEEQYHQIMSVAKITINEKISRLSRLFSQYRIKNYIPAVTQSDESELVAPFSLKYAAVQAGLGWIGKNDVLVTKEFGPRVRLAAILLDYPLACGSPIGKSLCGPCRACVAACPWGLITGVNWELTTKRAELLDYQMCNKKRSEYVKHKSRKHTCGYCLLACPWGLNKR